MKRPVRKAVITAAGYGTRHFPASHVVQKELFPLVDRFGISKPTIQLVVEEALAAGVEAICIVTQPGRAEEFQRHFQPLPPDSALVHKSAVRQQSEQLAELHGKLSYVVQSSADGFGHAVHCAAEWVGEEPFLLLLGDHVYLAPQVGSCGRQLIAAYEASQQPVFGVQQTDISQLHLFGTVRGGARLHQQPPTWQALAVHEKPGPEFARSRCQTAGLAPDRFLTFFGLYLLTPAIFTILGQHIARNQRQHGEIQLTPALAELLQTQGGLAVELEGKRLDMGTPLGYVETQLALAWHSPFAEELKKSMALTGENG